MASDERMNGKDLEGSGRDVADVYFGTFLEGLRTTVKYITVSIADVSAKIRTDHFRNTGQEHYG
jgi:hypothetical protein